MNQVNITILIIKYNERGMSLIKNKLINRRAMEFRGNQIELNPIFLDQIGINEFYNKKIKFERHHEIKTMRTHYCYNLVEGALTAEL